MLALIVSGTLTEVFESAEEVHDVDTPFGKPSAPIEIHKVGDVSCAVLYRHDKENSTYAHRVNYRANVWALNEMGATQIVGYATTGSVDPTLEPGTFVVPDQIIDYTHSRIGSFETEGITEHFDFAYPFDEALRSHVLASAQIAELNPIDGGTYACTQGPRFETAAEIAKYGQDGCSIVGMTLMPEAPLARQLELPYAALAYVMNPGAGIGGKPVDIPGSIRFTDAAVKPMRHFNQCLVERVHQSL